MPEYLFSYGTLQKEKVQTDLFGRILPGVRDALSGYLLVTTEIMDEVFLSKGEEKFQQTLVLSDNSEDKIAGTVFEITEADLNTADKYEPGNYKRTKVRLESGIEAWVYIAGSHSS